MECSKHKLPVLSGSLSRLQQYLHFRFGATHTRLAASDCQRQHSAFCHVCPALSFIYLQALCIKNFSITCQISGIPGSMLKISHSRCMLRFKLRNPANAPCRSQVSTYSLCSVLCLRFLIQTLQPRPTCSRPSVIQGSKRSLCRQSL